MADSALNLFKRRRSQYALGKTLPFAHEQVTKLVQECVKHTPSAFNSQGNRVVLLYGKESLKFWGFVNDALLKIVPAENRASTENKINSFAAGAGTILFFEDEKIVKNLQKQFPNYADNFPVWAGHSNGMVQFAVWVALADAGIGASLQHYNPLIDGVTAEEWHLPPHWKLRSQMPFGSNESGLPEKSFIDEAEYFRVYE